MNAFLWTIAVLGIFEAGGALAYWVVGAVPRRTMASVLINGVFWAVLAFWAVSLMGGAA